MKRLLFFTLAVAALCLLLTAPPKTTSAQQESAASADAEKVLAAFRAKEAEFRRVLNGYGFKRDAILQSIGMGGQVTGEYRRVSFITFDPQGGQLEKIITFPIPTLTPDVADLEDLNTIQIFGIEARKFDLYKFSYVGKERVDELNTYVFDVTPKVMPDPKKSKERFFQGRIWIDDRDMQLVKAKGKGVPQGKQRFPTFETYREQVDGRYWFPSYTYADDKLVLPSGNVLHIRMRIRFTDYENPPAREMIPDSKLVVAATTPARPAESTATPQSTPTDGPVTGIVLDGRAIELPKPDYPAEAKKAGIKGTVTVRLVIDEKGLVTSAEAVEGPKELREAAVKAAMKARFTPTLLDGKPVKVTGVITYSFTF